MPELNKANSVKKKTRYNIVIGGSEDGPWSKWKSCPFPLARCPVSTSTFSISTRYPSTVGGSTFKDVLDAAVGVAAVVAADAADGHVLVRRVRAVPERTARPTFFFSKSGRSLRPIRFIFHFTTKWTNLVP